MSESLLNRIYTPPTEGTFDPYTAAITGTIPSFFSYQEPPPPAQAPLATLSELTGLASSEGSDGGVGGIDLGPNPGNLGSLGGLSNIDPSNVSLSGGFRGAGLGGMVAGPVGALIGGALGAFGPAIADALNQQETARAQQAIHDRAVEAMFAGMDAYGGFATPQDQDQAIANAVAANIDADYGPGGVFGGDGGGGGDGQGGEGGDASGDGQGNKKGGLIKLAGGGVVALEGGGKVAIGPGGGLDDLIPTSINGRRAAALSDGEFVIPADVVSMMGDGSSNAGARRLYDLVRQVRDTKTGTTRQAGPLPVGEILKRSMSR